MTGLAKHASGGQAPGSLPALEACVWDGQGGVCGLSGVRVGEGRRQDAEVIVAKAGQSLLSSRNKRRLRMLF